MTYLLLILNLISGTFIWFFLGQLAFKVDPTCAIIVFSLLLINHVTKILIKLGEKK
jgi:hypothetical protein